DERAAWEPLWKGYQSYWAGALPRRVCPLYPQKRTSLKTACMSAKCHKGQAVIVALRLLKGSFLTIGAAISKRRMLTLECSSVVEKPRDIAKRITRLARRDMATSLGEIRAN